MKELIDKIKEMLENPEVEKKVWLTDEDRHPLVKEISSMATSLLIDNEGRCNWDAHEELKAAGFRVTAGETDSFGWLTGVIHTPKGKIVYG